MNCLPQLSKLKACILRYIKLVALQPRAMLRRWRDPLWWRYRRRLGLSLRQWLSYHQQHIVFEHCRWMGIPALKNPLDAWIYQEIIAEVRPEVIIEIGSKYGGSTLYLAHLLDALGQGSVLSLDIDRSEFRATHPRIVTLTGDSGSPAMIARVAEHCQGRRVLAIHDGNHARAAVYRDLCAYAPLVSANSYFIVEDGIVDLFVPGDGIGWNEEGPLAAIRQFLREHPHYQVDDQRERYLITYNPQGFLKRIR